MEKRQQTGARFAARRRAALTSSSERGSCTVSSFLVMVASVWVIVLIVFSVALLVQEQRASVTSMRMAEIKHLKGKVDELRGQLDDLHVKQEMHQKSKLRASFNPESQSGGGEGAEVVVAAASQGKPVAGDISSSGAAAAEVPAVPPPAAPVAAAAAAAVAPPQQAAAPPPPPPAAAEAPSANAAAAAPPPADAAAPAPPPAPPAPPVASVGGEAVYDSNTSPVPLVDPTILTRVQHPFEGELDKLCTGRGDPDAKMLEHVNVWEGSRMGSPRILCLSYTLSSAHPTAVKNIQETWGRRCDGYLAMSDLTDPAVPSVDIKHQGPEAYGNMWQKVRSIWLYVHKHHARDFDYFMIGGDDLFIIVENLRKYLSSGEISQATDGGKKPIFLGRRFLPPNEQVVFNSGGAGYVINTAALEVLAAGLKGDNCRPNMVGFWEDMNVADCLHKGGVDAYDTRDSTGAERFLPFPPAHHFLYKVPPLEDWYVKYTRNVGGLKEGLAGVSTAAISFHYIKGDMMQRVYALLYGLCPKIAAS